MTLLEARGLAVTPPGAPEPTVSGFSLAVAPGEWIALTGPNGGGKTSLLLGLAGLWPVQGELRLGGAAFGPGAEPAARRGLAVVLQDPSSQTLQATVRDEIAFAARNFGLGEDEAARGVERWSRAFGLEDELDRDPARLSAGRQQLVLLAAALAPEPKVLIADEPTAHLDPRARRLVRDRISERVAAGMGVVWATQLAEEIAIAHRTVTVGGPCEGSLPAGPWPRPRPALLEIRVLPRGLADGPGVATNRRLELEIGDRGVTGITGPNGAGKTVLLWAAAGLGMPEQVQLEWIGTPEPPPIAALQFPELQVFEEDPLDEVTFAATQRGMTRDAALALARNHLRDLGLNLDDLAGRRTWSLAGGEKRLLEVVAALISPSSLCALDEPTAGLDPARRVALAGLVARISERTPVLVASQDREWLRAVGARVFDLAEAAETMSQPAH